MYSSFRRTLLVRERDDLRSDIDNLKERVANLEASIEQMNTDINNYQQMVAGTILVMGYSQDEQGNYIVELSNGETVKIYSGKADMNDMLYSTSMHQETGLYYKWRNFRTIVQ